MHRTSARLSDGREIIYFSRTPGNQPPPDVRELEAQTLASEVRYDLQTGDWIVVAGHRQTRGLQRGADDCPLCPSGPGRPTEVPAADYEVVVFENRFPALTMAAAKDSPIPRALQPALRAAPGAGRCEVICFSPDHETTLAEMKTDRVRLILDAWTDRTRELGRLPGVAQVFCFENRGPEMGVSQSHPHGQIYAYPFVTPRTSRMLRQMLDHQRTYGRNMFDDIVEAELADARRLVLAADEWIAFVPFAARWPYEVHLYPRRRCRDLTGLDEPQREAFAPVYLDLLQRFERLFDGPTPYVSAWHQAPNVAGVDDFALHLELFTNRRAADRLKVLGGTEVAMDAFSNDIRPEVAAQRLRELRDIPGTGPSDERSWLSGQPHMHNAAAAQP